VASELGELTHACLDVMIKIRSFLSILSHRCQCQDEVPHLYNTVSLASIEVTRRTHQRTDMYGQFEYAEVKGFLCTPLASSCCFLRFPWVAFARPCTAAYLLSLQTVAKAILPQLFLYTNLPFLHPRIFRGLYSPPPHQHSMSLDTLSGELILIIPDYLSEHPGALPTLCLVSKRVRKFAELVLYKHIVLRGDGKLRATKLLMTLMKRNDLALRAPTVDIQEERYAQVDPDIQSRLEIREAAIRRLIENLVSITSNSRYAPLSKYQKWYLGITAPRPGDTDHSTIALILCMVINVNRTRLLHQCDNFGRLMLTVLATSWKDTEIRPFKHLESVIIHGMVWRKSLKASLPSSMKSLEFDNNSIGSVNPFISPIPPHTLELKRVYDLTPDLLRNILRYDHLVRLKVLTVERDMPESMSLSFKADLNIGFLVKALALHTPLLERFTWINRQHPRWYQSPDDKFGSFKSLSQLKHLHVERGNFTNDHLFSHATICALQRNIPEGLQSLTIADYPKMLARNGEPLTSPILRTSHKTTDLTQALSRAFVSPTSKFSLRRLTLTVRMESYSDDGCRLHGLNASEATLLRHMADELAKAELIFEVHRKIHGAFRHGYRLLVGPGWTASLPHARFSDEIDRPLP
jgi:hypothetical protein